MRKFLRILAKCINDMPFVSGRTRRIIQELAGGEEEFPQVSRKYRVEWRDDRKGVKSLGDMFTDVLIHTFDFLDADDIMNCSIVNNNWRDAARHDFLWEWRYKTHRFKYLHVPPRRDLEGDYFDAFRECYNEEVATKKIVELLPVKIEELEKWTPFRHIYGHVLPWILCFSTFLSVLILPFLIKRKEDEKSYLDNSIWWVWLISYLPQLCCLIPSLCIFLPMLCFDANFFAKKFQKLYQLDQRNDPYRPQISDKTRLGVQLLILGFLFYPLLPICFSLRGVLGAHYVPYTVCFLPIFLVTLSLCWLPVRYIRYLNSKEESDSPLLWLYIFGLNLLLNFQILVVTLYLDGAIPHFNRYVIPVLIFSPSILLYCWVVCVPITCCIPFLISLTVFRGGSEEEQQEYVEPFFYMGCLGGMIAVCVCPLVLFVVILVLMLMGIIPFPVPFVLAFCPLWCWLLPCCCIPCISFSRKRQDFWTSL